MMIFSGGSAHYNLHLHIQCPWRVLSDGRLVTGSGDQWSTADEDYREGLDFRESLGYLTVKRVLDGNVVRSASSTAWGDVVLRFASGDELQCFQSSRKLEAWRIFETPAPVPHIFWEGELKG